MNITVVSEPTVLGKVRAIGDIQEALLVFVDDGLGLRGVPEFQAHVRISTALTLGVHVSEIRIAGLPEHLFRDGIKLVVSDEIFDRLSSRDDNVRLFGDIVIGAVDGYIRQLNNTS